MKSAAASSGPRSSSRGQLIAFVMGSVYVQVRTRSCMHEHVPTYLIMWLHGDTKCMFAHMCNYLLILIASAICLDMFEALAASSFHELLG